MTDSFPLFILPIGSNSKKSVKEGGNGPGTKFNRVSNTIENKAMPLALPEKTKRGIEKFVFSQICDDLSVIGEKNAGIWDGDSNTWQVKFNPFMKALDSLSKYGTALLVEDDGKAPAGKASVVFKARGMELEIIFSDISCLGQKAIELRVNKEAVCNASTTLEMDAASGEKIMGLLLDAAGRIMNYFPPEQDGQDSKAMKVPAEIRAKIKEAVKPIDREALFSALAEAAGMLSEKPPLPCAGMEIDIDKSEIRMRSTLFDGREYTYKIFPIGDCLRGAGIEVDLKIAGNVVFNDYLMFHGHEKISKAIEDIVFKVHPTEYELVQGIQKLTGLALISRED